MKAHRYIAYETELEELRLLRKEQKGLTGKKSLADHAMVRRCHFIFERATRKFVGDLRLWLRWLEYCRQSDSARQTSRVRPCTCEARHKMQMRVFDSWDAGTLRGLSVCTRARM